MVKTNKINTFHSFGGILLTNHILNKSQKLGST